MRPVLVGGLVRLYGSVSIFGVLAFGVADAATSWGRVNPKGKP